MRHYLIAPLLILLSSLLPLRGDALPLYGRSFLLPRSANNDLARRLVGTSLAICACDDAPCGTIAATLQHNESFREYRIAQYFFSESTLSISGSTVADRSATALLADYFGLAQSFDGNAHFTPHLSTTVADFIFRCNYRQWYLEICAPVVAVTTELSVHENIAIGSTDTPFPALYMDTGAVAPVYSSFSCALAGGTPYGQIAPLLNGRLCPKQKAHGISDILTVLGFWYDQSDIRRLSFNLCAIAPTGTRSQGVCLFEPVIGNGHHAEFGAGFLGQWLLRQNYDECTSLALTAALRLTHLFWAYQWRTFDFGRQDFIFPDFLFLSRYQLLKEFDAQGNYTGRSLPAINSTRLLARTSCPAQLNGLLMFTYHTPRWQADLGYEAWFRSGEKIRLCEQFPGNRYGLKGIQNVAGAGINSTQSTATIYGNPFSEQAALADTPSPVLLTPQDIDPQSGAVPPVFTHKLFCCVASSPPSYSTAAALPFMGIGAAIEFEGLNIRDQVQSDQNAISQWSFFIKMGLYF